MTFRIWSNQGIGPSNRRPGNADSMTVDSKDDFREFGANLEYAGLVDIPRSEVPE
jgi:hypothetical protein